MGTAQNDKAPVGLLGFCIPAYEAMDNAGRPFVAVVPPEFESYMKEHGIAHVLWDFDRVNDRSIQLANELREQGVNLAVPLYEPTVEWAGALNGQFREDPRLFTRYLLFRDKAMMKRRAQMNGIRVGLFEEADDRAGVRRFLERVQKANIRLEGDEIGMVHLKPLDAAGCLGHRVLRTVADAERIEEDEFPCLLETHLEGQEFSCEVFIHNRKVRFLNITEYVHLGHSNFVPASKSLEARRPQIQRAIEDLIAAFDIEYGMIHPEFFITPDNVISFGEVAARVPGGHIFELIEKAYGFSPFEAFVMCADPSSTDEEIEAFFPDPSKTDDFAGCLMVYPRQKVVTRLDMPEELLADPYYEKHNLFVPVTPKVADRVAFGDHYGTIYFRGSDPDEMRDRLRRYEDMDYYTNESQGAAGSEARSENALAS